jgi:signal transduction histidine kinase
VVPLLTSDDTDNPVGSFSLYANQLRDFSDWDKRLLTCLANHAAVAIRDAGQLAQLQLTRQRQATAETFAAVGDVSANLLHQLNNKFGAISLRVQGIEDKCAEALDAWPYLAENLRGIAQSTRHAMAIVRDSMAQLHPSESQPVEIQLCLERALQRARPPSTIEVMQQEGLKNLPRVRAGEKQLEMVFYNLIHNAQKAMGGKGELRITGQQQNNGVTVAIADTGPGILPEEIEQIFEFTPATAQSNDGRLGFGLWWVKTFVDRFGGWVEVDSTPGEGSVFSVWLPIYRET